MRPATTLPARPSRPHAPAGGGSVRERPGTPSALFLADWMRVVFVHFAVAPADLAPHVPHPLDLRDGRAFVSLVSFSLERLRPGRLMLPQLGRTLLGPISEHGFLNVRTYVRGPAGPGVHFLAEWIDNPISLHLGPVTYGLPYRFAEIDRADLPSGGLTQIRVTDCESEMSLGITVPYSPDAPVAVARDGSLDEFLVERYTAYTQRRGVDRYFHIAHRPWEILPVDLVRTDTTLLEAMYPWFTRAELVGAQIGPGVRDVVIGRPHKCAALHERNGAAEAAPLPVAAASAGVGR